MSYSWQTMPSDNDFSTGAIIYASHINILINNIHYEQQRRKQTVTSTPASVDTGYIIYASTFKELSTAINNIKSISGLPSIDTGSVIYASHMRTWRNAVTTLHNICVCQCYYCTCNCNYYCTCNCYYCTCNCYYYCTCNCNYSSSYSCNCNYTATTPYPSWGSRTAPSCVTNTYAYCGCDKYYNGYNGEGYYSTNCNYHENKSTDYYR